MKKTIKNLLQQYGYKLSKLNANNILNENPLLAVKDKIANNPVLFDIGANNGQTIEKMLSIYPLAQIHSFEPSKGCFRILEDKIQQNKNIKINNLAVGSEIGSLEFNEYSWSPLNSLLKRAYTQAEIVESYFVDVTTVDNYCKNNSVSNINLLKTDTEGFELNVLKGASKMMDENRIQFVFVEVFFSENYIGQSSFGDIYNYLLEKGFNLVRLYDFEYNPEGLANRTDALFINKNYKEHKVI